VQTQFIDAVTSEQAFEGRQQRSPIPETTSALEHSDLMKEGCVLRLFPHPSDPGPADELAAAIDGRPQPVSSLDGVREFALEDRTELLAGSVDRPVRRPGRVRTCSAA
jgi:hypothetical protein